MSNDPDTKSVTKYNFVTGRILGIGIVPIDSAPEDGQGWLAGHSSGREHYYDIAEDVIRPRMALGASLSATSITLGASVTLAPLPIPCTVRIDGTTEPVVVEDGSLEVTPTSIGEAYRLMVDEVQFLRTDYFFSVVDP
jgi:hypothetical protein